MLPLKDNVPTRAFPAVTVALIAANVIVWLWEWQTGVEKEVMHYGYYPCSVEGPCVAPASVDHPCPGSWARSPRCSCTRAGSTSAATCSSSGSSATTSRTRWAARASSSGTCWPASRRRRPRPCHPRHHRRGGREHPQHRRLGRDRRRARRVPAAAAAGERADRLHHRLFLREIPAYWFIGFWFLLQLVEGGFSIAQPQSGGGTAFFAHVGGFVFGLATVRLFAERPPLRPAW